MSARRLPDRSATFVAAFVVAMACATSLSACPDDHPIEARIASVDERLDLQLEDGRLLQIAGLEPPRASPAAPDRPESARARLAEWLVGLPVAFRPLSANPDRWGRLPVRLLADSPGAEPDAARLDVAVAILDAGMARFRPAPLLGDCRTALLAAEARARRARLGLWTDPVHAIVSATDRAALASRAAAEIIVEGRIARVGETRFRTYLNFGPIRGQDFAVTILKRNRATFDKVGIPLHALAGRSIRVRGLLETRFGPQIEIASPAEMEILDAPGAASAGNGDNAAK